MVVIRDVKDRYWLERFAQDTGVATGVATGMTIAPMRMNFARRTAVLGTMMHRFARR